MVFVDVLRVSRMMHPVMGRSVEDELIPTGQAIDQLGVYPELIECIEGRNVEKPHIVEAEKRQRQKERSGEELLQCTLAQRYTQVVIFTLVMYHMTYPKQINLVAHAVGPVITKIDTQIQENQPRPGGWNGKEAVLLVNDAEGCHREYLDEQTRELFKYTTTDVGENITNAVELLPFHPCPHQLSNDEQEEDRYAEDYGIQSIRVGVCSTSALGLAAISSLLHAVHRRGAYS